MPKMTVTGQELGCSELPDIVLLKTVYGDRQKVWQKHHNALNGVEVIDDIMFENARNRGNFLEKGTADWGLHILKQQETCKNITMSQPKQALRMEDIKLGASLDFILDVKGSVIVKDVKGMPVELTGQINFQIKTDMYHKNKCKPEWVIQVTGEMMCSDIPNTIVCCYSQLGRLHFYAIPRDENLCQVIYENVNEFWELIKTGTNYPPVTQNERNTPIDLITELPQHKSTHQALKQMCSDYLKLSGEERSFRKEKEELKSQIIDALDMIEIDHCLIDGFEIKAKTITKSKKEYVETGELYESTQFSIKETE